jgi:hypothetical protein
MRLLFNLIETKLPKLHSTPASTLSIEFANGAPAHLRRICGIVPLFF